MASTIAEPPRYARHGRPARKITDMSRSADISPQAAAEIAAWGNTEVCAHHAGGPFLRGEAPGPPPDLADWERPIFDQVSRRLPATPPAPVRIDRELGDGDELVFGGGAVTVGLPGHTPGSTGFYLPGPRLLLAGDTAARSPSGQVMPGVFNTDRTQAAASFRRLAGLDTDIAGFGHGEPVSRDAAAHLQAAARAGASDTECSSRFCFALRTARG
jgi:glyoxylase-like metal-dependent hydrolase (beta-lactamase superfamily II)